MNPGLLFTAERLGLCDASLLLRVDNLPTVQVMLRGCNTTRLDSSLVARIDGVARHLGEMIAVAWVSTELQLAGPLSCVPLGVAPPPEDSQRRWSLSLPK